MKSVEIVAIGDEVLTGYVVNSNAAFLSQQMSDLGYEVTAHHVFPDDERLLESDLERVLRGGALVIATGGLGPTCDDNSRQVASKLFNQGQRFDTRIAEDLKKRYGKALPSLNNQATVPSDAVVLMNRMGTAPGFIFETKDRTLILLPGVPSEMTEMFERDVVPYLKKRDQLEHSYVTRLGFLRMREQEIDPILRQIKNEHPQVNVGIYPSAHMVQVAFKVRAKDEQTANSTVSPLVEQLKLAFPNNYFPLNGRLEEELGMRLVEKGLTLSLAESCTGGALAARVTSVMGASRYFLGSLVCYSNELKQQVLGVSKETLERHGAVSEQTVREMVSGALKLTGSDFAIADTGIAGPGGGTPEKPVGTVWMAIGCKDGQIETWKLERSGTRTAIIEGAVGSAFSVLCKRLFDETTKTTKGT